ncbi:hypothetical protein [Chitinophaga sp. CF418]|uniref:hypothetical protein n=1 Tax=Chitinophaga sp. CF418 TaxID=1855287 RepID=UPI000917D8D6|nr:hypothetical protein [Chitinophaga sp. CF418]SHN29927.1 hypothetical protein SAMN05216311_108259 [Chitinophaga sp. CF418]
METSFNLHGIELLSFSLLPEPPAGSKEKQLSYEFNVQQEQKTNVDKQLVIVFTTITVIQSGYTLPLATVTAACGFGISSFDGTLTRQTSGEYLISPDIGQAVSRVATGITRGIFYSQLRGSYLQDCILPLLPGE